MKSKFKLLALIFAVILVASVFSLGTKVTATEVEESNEGISEALEGEQGANAEVPEIHEGDLYIFFGEDDPNSSTYVMDKYVDGNVFIFGNDVKITGTITGSLFVFANTLNIEESANVVAHIFAAAQDMEMSGLTSDMYAAASNFRMTDKAIVYRDLKLAADDAILRGGVGRDVDLVASTIDVFEDEDNSFYVVGDLNYTSGNEIEHINDITVEGNVTFKKAEAEDIDENTLSDYIYRAIENIISTLVIYAILIFLAPKFIEKSKEYVSTRALLAGTIGLAFTVLVPIVAFILLITLVGAPLAIAGVMVYIIVLMLNSAVVTIAINEFITNKFEKLNATWKKILMIIPVSLVIFLIKQIPYIGGWVSIVIFLVGVGIVTLYQFDKRLKKEVEA